MIDDLADVIAELGASYTARRGSVPTDDGHGRTLPGEPGEEFEIVASVQPLAGAELQRLPEGERVEDYLELYTAAELRTADTATGALADELVIDGVPYEVERVHPWGTTAGFMKCVIRKATR
jgi:hypothetical protein